MVYGDFIKFAIFYIFEADVDWFVHDIFEKVIIKAHIAG